MRTAVLERLTESDAGTFGRLTLDDGAKFLTGELPWRDNKTGKSCIPPGVYLCSWAISPKHGWCYHVDSVPGRSDVEIHSANWMGDVMKQNPVTGKPYQCQLLGCIALGTTTGMLDGQMSVLDSRHAIDGFHENLKRESFQLVIHDIPEPVVSVLGGELD